MQPIRRLARDETVPFHAVIGGERFGPFENQAAASGFEEIVGRRRDLSIAPVSDLYEGSIGGDAYYAVDTLALEYGMHPFREVHDIGHAHDNGEIMLDFARGSRFLPGDAIVLVEGATRHEPRRDLDKPERLPDRISLGDEHLETRVTAPHPAGGQLLVVQTNRRDCPPYLIAWRRDARMRMNLRVVSGHSSLDYASMRLEEAMERFTPSTPELAARKSRRPRDYQREKVYSLERSFGREHGQPYRWFKSIEECVELVHRMYEEFDLGPPPAIHLGRSNQSISYHKRGYGLSFSPHDLSAWTVLHEAAHHVAADISKEPGHGPTFVSTLMGMLAASEGVDLDMMVRLAREAEVDFDPDVVERWRERIEARASTGMAP